MTTVTSHQIELVQTSFRKMQPALGTATDLFYSRLFEVTPEVRKLFPEDMTALKQKLAEMLETTIGNLHQFYTVQPTLKALGERHVGYGVKTEHYALVGGALLWAIGKSLGPDYTPEVRAAWTEVYTSLAGAMNGTG